MQNGTVRYIGLIGGTREVGQLVKAKVNGEIKTFRVTDEITETTFLYHHPEWADPVFKGLLFEKYYRLESEEDRVALS